MVTSPAGVDRRAWELALVSEMRAALRAGDLVVEGSRRYTRWDAGLYSPEAWIRRRESWFAERGLPSDGAAFLTDLKEEVHEITVAVADRIPTNTQARVHNGKLALEALEAVQLPASAEEIRQALAGALPLVSLPELLLEVDRWTSFSKDLLHLTARGEPSPRHVAATRPALFAVLVAEATNIGLATMSRASGIPHGQLVRMVEGGAVFALPWVDPRGLEGGVMATLFVTYEIADGDHIDQRFASAFDGIFLHTFRMLPFRGGDPSPCSYNLILPNVPAASKVLRWAQEQPGESGCAHFPSVFELHVAEDRLDDFIGLFARKPQAFQNFSSHLRANLLVAIKMDAAGVRVLRGSHRFGHIMEQHGPGH